MQTPGYSGKIIKENVKHLAAESGDPVRKRPYLEINDRVARECINLAYGFFSPLEGFMRSEDVRSICERTTLKNGVMWPIPIILDIDRQTIEKKDIRTEMTIVLNYNHTPLALMEIEEIYSFDLIGLKQCVLGTTNSDHPGVRLYDQFQDTFLAGKIILLGHPSFLRPFKSFWFTPLELRKKISELGWRKVIAHQTRNVPHTGHEWLMKGAWLSTQAGKEEITNDTGILVSAVIGSKKTGDFIDEIILLGHEKLKESGYFRPEVHLVSFILWDMRYAGPKEALLHAIIRENLGCTHHMFGRDHAGVGSYYGPYDAHYIFHQISPATFRLQPVSVKEWWYCPVCDEVTYSGLCGHEKEKQSFSGTFLRRALKKKENPPTHLMRPEVLKVITDGADTYGFGSPFCTKKYLDQRLPVFLPFLHNHKY